MWNLKKILGFLLALCLTVSSLLGVYAQEMTLPTGLSCRAYCLVEIDSGRVIAEQNSHDQRAVASTTKIMTALLAIESGRLDEVVTVTEDDVKVEGSSLSLREGDRLTLSDLVRGMMTVSGNDAAHTIARFLAGDDEGFAQKMNDKAAALSMTATHFANPHGLPNDDHYSTAADMAKLAVAAMKEPLFVDIVSTYRNEITYLASTLGYTTRTLKNTNQLLNTVEGCVGVKTGYTVKAGHCLVSAVRREGAGVICVVLGGPDYWNDSRVLLEYGMTKVCYADILTETAEYQLNVVGGEADSVRVQNARYLAGSMTETDYNKLKITVTLPRFVYAPVKAGDRVGDIVVTVDGEPYETVPLVAMESVPMQDLSEGAKENLLNILRQNLTWLFQ